MLVLTSSATSRSLRFNVSTTVGRPLLDPIDPHGARYASTEQFEVRRGTRDGLEVWRVAPVATAKNPVYVNGRELRRRRVLRAGAVLSIGSHLPLVVSFQ